MCESDTDTRYLFLDLTEGPNEAESKKLAADFCACYSRSFAATAEVIAVEADALDAIIRVDGEEVVLEFARYHGRDAYLGMEQSESRLKGELGAAMKTAHVPDVDVLIWWAAKTTRQSQTVRVPQHSQRQDFIEEVVRVAKHVVANPEVSGKKVLFRLDPERMCRFDAYCILDREDYPITADHCSSLRIKIHDGIGFPEIRSSFTTRGVGLDEEALVQTVAKHCRAVYSTTRQVWLIVHSVGIRPSSYVPRPLRKKVLEVIGRAVSENAGRFARVFWAENTAYVDAIELFEVPVRV